MGILDLTDDISVQDLNTDTSEPPKKKTKARKKAQGRYQG
jgi:hypothetical protein